jgi:putative DNA primase/helicase
VDEVHRRRVTADALAEPDEDPRRAMLRDARRAESAHAVAGSLTLAATEPEMAVSPDQLDADPYLLNCANGTLDLHTMELREHDPAHLLTKVTRAAWRPDAASPEWDAFLATVQPDQAMRGYLGRVTGLSLEGRVTEHLLPVHWGSGANGKSTFIEGCMFALGDYAAPADPQLLTARTFDAHPTGAADLFGMRLAVLHETDKGSALAEATVKRLTGGDRIKARRMREDFWWFTPSHTFALLTNHKPTIGGTDTAIWRRLRLIPWTVQIPEDKQDRELGDRLRLSADAVLRWIVGGYADWRDHGLADPAEVTAATEAWRGESDALARFIEQQCLTGPHFHVGPRICSPPGANGAGPRTSRQAPRPRSRRSWPGAGTSRGTPGSATYGTASRSKTTARTTAVQAGEGCEGSTGSPPTRVGGHADNPSHPSRPFTTWENTKGANRMSMICYADPAAIDVDRVAARLRTMADSRQRANMRLSIRRWREGRP